LILGNNRVIPYNTIAVSNIIENYFPVETRKNLLMNMHTNNVEETANILRRIFDGFKAAPSNSEIIYVHCIELISTCIEFMAECKQDINCVFKNISDPFEEIYKIKKLSDIEQWILSTFKLTLDLIHTNKKNK
jgi:two-component system, response regulator YesN